MTNPNHVLKRVGPVCALFWCPGCNESHSVKIEGDGAWGWDGNLDEPTLTPSVMIKSGHYNTEHPIGDNCWCTYNANKPAHEHYFSCNQCHSYITNGQIRYLDDCSHHLKGQTVPLKPYPHHRCEQVIDI